MNYFKMFLCLVFFGLASQAMAWEPFCCQKQQSIPVMVQSLAPFPVYQYQVVPIYSVVYYPVVYLEYRPVVTQQYVVPVMSNIQYPVYKPHQIYRY
jgi:hypothetical protein